MDDFVLRALAAGTGIALAAGPLGCFVVWRRMAYFGAAVSHSALLGLALGLILGVAPGVGVLGTCVAVALALAALERGRALPTDTVLGVLAHVALAAGLVAVALLESVRVDLMAYLLGDLLAVSGADLVEIAALAALALAGLAWRWRDLLSITVDEDLAAVEGVAVERHRLGLALLLAAVVAVGMKLVGVLLVVSMLIVPAAAARALARTPESMAAIATALGVAAVGGGLAASVTLDAPAGPAVVLVAALWLVLALAAARWRRVRGATAPA